MSDDFEDLLKRWLRDRAGHDRSALQALAGNVAALPPRRRQPARLLPLAASVVVVIGLLALTAPRFGFVGGDASPSAQAARSAEASGSPTLPGGPEAFADDPRLGRCYGMPRDMEFVFEMSPARDYQRYMPRIGRSPELEVDAPVFVVVYRESFQGVAITGAAVEGQPPTPIPGRRFVCAVLPDNQPILYSNVDIMGLTIDIVPSSDAPSSSSNVTPSHAINFQTPEPAPAWAGDATAGLSCDGEPSGYGSEGPPGGTAEESTPDVAVRAYLRDVAYFSLPFPTRGFVELDRTDSWSLHGYVVDGRARAVIVVHGRSDYASGPWVVTDVASCDPSEFGPDVVLGTPIVIWTDRLGTRVPTTTLLEIGDCYNATRLTINGRLFVWDPSGDENAAFDPSVLESTFGADVALPPDAVETGYRDGPRRLYLAADSASAYVSTPAGVQRWPHVKGDEYPRIDCN